MAQVRFLDQVSVNSFSSGGNDTSNGTPIPRIILAGQSFSVSPNTTSTAYNVSVYGTLIINQGSELEAPDGTVVRTDGQLWVGNILDNQGTIINDGLIVVGDG